jgi:hypothetical protein
MCAIFVRYRHPESVWVRKGVGAKEGCVRLGRCLPHSYLTGSVHKFVLKKSIPQLVNLSDIVTKIKCKLTDSCENRLLQSDFINAFCEMNFLALLDSICAGQQVFHAALLHCSFLSENIFWQVNMRADLIRQR